MLMPKEEIFKSPWINVLSKGIAGAFLIGVAWNRLEYKLDQTSEKILKKIDEHILSDGFEKQIMNSRIDELNEKVKALQYKADRYQPDEFVRPSEPRIETDKRNRRYVEKKPVNTYYS